MRDKSLDALKRVPTPFGAMFPLKFDRVLRFYHVLIFIILISFLPFASRVSFCIEGEN